MQRFSNAAKLCAYAGLVPRTYASGGKVYQGPLLKSRNKWLQWAFIEAAWVAISCSAYFGGLYRLHRARGKNANLAITIIARRMCQISFTLLKERRDFSETFPGRSAVRLTAAAYEKASARLGSEWRTGDLILPVAVCPLRSPLLRRED